jgi:hypothetical protein
MIFFLTGAERQNELDGLKELYVVNIDVRDQISYKDFLNIIKKELRNIEIECLVIDIEIFNQVENLGLKNAIESFLLISPDCKVIVLFSDNKQNMCEDEKVQNTSNVSYIVSDNPTMDIITILCDPEIMSATYLDDPQEELSESIIYKGDQDKEVKDSSQSFEDEISIVEIGDSLSISLDQADEEEDNFEIISDKTDQVMENENNQYVQPNDIFNKASVLIKTSAGTPLKKKMIKSQADSVDTISKKDHRKAEKLSSKVKKFQREISKSNWKCTNIMIGIAGIERSTGTTTAAMELANYLNNEGAKVLYSEANKHNHLPDIASWLSFKAEDDHYINNDIYYYPESQFDQELGVHFIILDIGSISENKNRTMKIMSGMDEIILVSGNKLYERHALTAALKELHELDVHILFNLTDEEDLPDLKKIYVNKAKSILSLPYKRFPYQEDIHLCMSEMFLPYMKKHQAV